MQPITLAGLVLSLLLLFLRYRAESKKPKRPRTVRQRVMTVKVILMALIVWLTVSSALRHTIDGGAAEPTWIDRVLSFLKN